MPYSEKMLNYFYHPAHAGKLVGEGVLSIEQGTAEQGDVLVFYCQLNQDEIITARFQVYGSAALLASAEYVCTWLEGKTKTQALKLKPEMILTALELPTFKLHTANLLCRAIQRLLG